MEPTYTRLHQTAAIGENSKRRFLRDMAGVHWGPPCFGYQGGPQQTPAIPPEKSNYRHSSFETKCPKAIVVPAHFYIGALVVYPPSPPTISTGGSRRSRVRSTAACGGLPLTACPGCATPPARRGIYPPEPPPFP